MKPFFFFFFDEEENDNTPKKKKHMAEKKKIYKILDRESIIECLKDKSESIIKLINSTSDNFVLYYKDITHSDLASSGKRTKATQDFGKNVLYYLTAGEMKDIEDNSDQPFQTAHQTCIGFPVEMYDYLKVPKPRDGEKYLLSDKGVNTFVVNDTLEYFNFTQTQKVVEKLGKTEFLWKEEEGSYKLDDGDFTNMPIGVAVHGLGVSTLNPDFHKLRLSIFMNDRVYVLLRLSETQKELYFLLDKNPAFYTLAGAANSSWAKYLKTIRTQQDAKSQITQTKLLNEDDEKTRQMQSKWKEQLAAEMRNYTTHEGEVFCPLTNITAEFEDVPMLFIASHIKRFADSSAPEAYDINNGLLLSANADALFDKHMITITEDKELKFSFLLEKNKKLIHDLRLNQPIFEMILNDERMEYMKDHRRIFEEKEKARKGIA